MYLHTWSSQYKLFSVTSVHKQRLLRSGNKVLSHARQLTQWAVQYPLSLLWTVLLWANIVMTDTS